MSARHIPEHALQFIWSHQYLRSANLRATDGRPVQVLQPGIVSWDAGPDIHNIKVVIGGVVYTGSAEVHRTAVEWDTHGHSADPRYNTVVLHIIHQTPPEDYRTRTESGRIVPMVPLEHALSDSLEHVLRDAMLDVHDDRTGRIHCGGLNDHVPADVIAAWLDALATERFEIKLRRYEERLRELARRRGGTIREHGAGWAQDGDQNEIPDPGESPYDLASSEVWDQLLYEGLMEGLGYSRNRRPFLTLSRGLTIDVLRRKAGTAIQIEAFLFGVSGLLPDIATLDDAESRAYVHSLRREWRQIAAAYAGPFLTAADWVPSPARPSNTPVVRLIAARSLVGKILGENLFRALVRTLTTHVQDVRAHLHTLLHVVPGPFWERRASFGRIIPCRLQPLGSDRRDDLIVNAIAPLFLLYARIFHDRNLRFGILSMLSAYPSLAANSTTKRIERHLLKGKLSLRKATHHQAAIQLYNYYCSKDRCRECLVGKAVWG